jgi:hypothetical protein
VTLPTKFNLNQSGHTSIGTLINVLKEIGYENPTIINVPICDVDVSTKKKVTHMENYIG